MIVNIIKLIYHCEWSKFIPCMKDDKKLTKQIQKTCTNRNTNFYWQQIHR